MPLDTVVQRADQYRSNYITGARPGACGGHWCPTNASECDDRPADHVDRLRQVGQHVLRAAGAEGRRGEGGPDGRAARADTGAPTSTSMHGLAGARPTSWGAFTLGVSRHHPAGDGQRVRDAGRRRASTASRCRSLDRPARTAARRSTTGRQPRWPRRAATRSSAGGGPGRDRRGPLLDRVRRRRRAAAAAGRPPPSVYGTVGPAGRPARPAPPTTPGRPGSSASRRSWPRPASSPTRTTRSTSSATGNSQKPVNAVAETLRDALKDQPVKNFKAPSGRLAG